MRNKSGKKVATIESPDPVNITEDLTFRESPNYDFPIVGLGASAGGLEALKEFFSRVTETSGLSYIVVVHMMPKFPSMLSDLIRNISKIPVLDAVDGLEIKPNHIYVTLPNKEIAIFKGKIQLMDLVREGVIHPIDSFLKSLARDQLSRAVAIILSGTGTDGTFGAKEIKIKGGLILAQRSESAGYSGMPQSVIDSGIVDMILSPEEMPEYLNQYFLSHAKNFNKLSDTSYLKEQTEGLNKVFSILRDQIGHDFSKYKISSMLRRITHRMELNQIESINKYVRFLKEFPNEVDVLFKELLIGVTNFFRDAESFEILKTKILPQLIEPMEADDTLRVWIPGCSTGEEVYSLAIIFHECLDKISKPINLLLFGTDIDNTAIDRARQGLYPKGISIDVSAERLKRFFTQEGEYYRISRTIRDSVIFSVHDIIKDSPFSRLHLLCCRNLLIYLDSHTQKKLLPLFHFTLNPGGILMLGSSETIGGFSNLFEIVDNKWKLYKRIEGSRDNRGPVDFPGKPANLNLAKVNVSSAIQKKRADISQLVQKEILENFALTTILINASNEILHVQGNTEKYLETPSGFPTFNILDMAREGLGLELSFAIREAKSANKNVTRRNVAVKNNGGIHMIDLYVYPKSTPKEFAGFLLIVFKALADEPVIPGLVKEERDEGHLESKRITELEGELRITREVQQATIEELESSNDELKSANQELQSTNEELQSTNEELESSREELQLLNEEMRAVNEELQNKLKELSEAQNDMSSLKIATIFVDRDLKVRSFSQDAAIIVNLISADLGRPLKHLTTNLLFDDLNANLAEVMKSLMPKVAEVQTTDGQWFNMRIAPYRTKNNRVEGAVLTFASIFDQKKAQEELNSSILQIKQAWGLVRATFDINSDPLVVLDKNARIVIGNKAFSELMNLPQEDLKEQDLLNLQNGIMKQSNLLEKLNAASSQDENFDSNIIDLESKGSKVRFVIHGRIVSIGDNSPYFILLKFERRE